jgi:hypothetical protein
MSVQALPVPEVSAALRIAQDGIAAAAAVSPSVLSEDEVTAGIEAAAVVEAQAAALRLRLMAEADRRRLAQRAGATGTDAWVARLTGSTRSAMAGGLWLAHRLQERYHLTAGAFADGGINQAQARAVVTAAEALPAEVDEDQRRSAEAGLVAKAVAGMDARRLRQAGRRMLDRVSRELADVHEAAQLRREERRAEAETFMELHDNGDGTFSGKFTIPELHGQMLRTALERLTSPQRLSRNKAGEVVVDESLPGGGPRLNVYERMGLGLCELVEHLPTAACGGFARVGATVIVTLPYQRLLDGLASARLDTGVAVSAGEARRLACNAGIVPAVLGSRGEPLDLGREVRLHTAAMRRAAALVHDTCAVEGCERPFAWCDMHHPDPWSRGGPTSVANSLPLCGFHHRRAHDDAFVMHRLPTSEVRFRHRR